MYCSGIALVRFDEPGLVRGQVRAVDSDTLAKWDGIEGISHGLYQRVRITTREGVDCWAYQFNRSVQGCQVIKSGVWTR